ncbi:MAG: type II secretion system protein GspF, partial [Proteobacteria bacterium]
MPIFEYKAYDPAGKPARGIVDSENSKTARLKLKKQGLAVFEISEKSQSSSKQARANEQRASTGLFASKASVKDIAMMTRQLASLIKANITLVESLSAMVEQTEDPMIKLVLAQVKQDVNEGMSLGKALGKHPRVFDNIFVNMIEAGESSGTLGVVLLKLADLKEAQMRLRSKVMAGMTYPALMMGVAFLLLIAMFTFVIPKMKEIFVSMNKPMPAITQFLIGMSDFVVGYWWLIGAAMFGAAVFFNKWVNTPKGRAKWDGFKLKLPVIGTLVRMIGVTRFASTMSTLLASGVPILSAMNISKNLVGNTLMADAIASARENITEGQSIATPLQRSGQFPPVVIHMIAIGEKTGELPSMLKNVAETYEEQVSARIEGMTA